MAIILPLAVGQSTSWGGYIAFAVIQLMGRLYKVFLATPLFQSVEWIQARRAKADAFRCKPPHGVKKFSHDIYVISVVSKTETFSALAACLAYFVAKWLKDSEKSIFASQYDAQAGKPYSWYGSAKESMNFIEPGISGMNPENQIPGQVTSPSTITGIGLTISELGLTPEQATLLNQSPTTMYGCRIQDVWYDYVWPKGELTQKFLVLYFLQECCHDIFVRWVCKNIIGEGHSDFGRYVGHWKHQNTRKSMVIWYASVLGMINQVLFTGVSSQLTRAGPWRELKPCFEE